MIEMRQVKTEILAPAIWTARGKPNLGLALIADSLYLRSAICRSFNHVCKKAVARCVIWDAQRGKS